MRALVFVPFVVAALSGTAFGADVRISDGRVVEGNAGQRAVEVLVVVAPAPTAAVTMSYNTRDGSAVAGSDYVQASGTVTFARGENTKRITVNVIGDTAVEPDEAFEVVLSNVSGAALADPAGTVTIVNDDGGTPFATYEVRFTYTGHTGSMANTPGCPVRNNGTVVLTGLLTGNERVPRDEDIAYEGTLSLDADIDLCEVTRDARGEDKLCAIRVVGVSQLKVRLEIKADDRDGYVQTYVIPNTSLSAMFGSCDAALINDERPLFPNDTKANTFNGAQLKIPSGPLRVGRYLTDEMIVEVLRVVGR